MIRKKVFVEMGGYNESQKMMEDYELWLRAMPHTGLCNLKQRLLNYRWHGNNLTSQQSVKLSDAANLGALTSSGLASDDLGALRSLRDRSHIRNPGDAIIASRLLSRIASDYLRMDLDESEMTEITSACSHIWLSLLLRSLGNTRAAFGIAREAQSVLGNYSMFWWQNGIRKMIENGLLQRELARLAKTENGE
jgi:hypothetical protein